MDRERFIPTRRSLLSRLKSWDNHDSWRDFFNTYWRLIYDFALKAGLNEAQAEDAVQETIISVAQQMPGFSYDPALGSFKSWLMQITRRRIADQLRKRYRTGDVGALPSDDPASAALLGETPDSSSARLEVLWEEEWREHIADVALTKIRRRVRPEQFQMFEFAVLKGWSASKVAEALGVSLTQVYMARHRVGKLVKREIQHLERSMI
jgi:RNA polymerase sigma-70 factor (ECF subfamily)